MVGWVLDFVDAVEWLVMNVNCEFRIPSSWLRKPLYRRCGNGERASATEVARAAVDGVVGGAAGTSAFAFQLFCPDAHGLLPPLSPF